MCYFVNHSINVLCESLSTPCSKPVIRNLEIEQTDLNTIKTIQKQTRKALDDTGEKKTSEKSIYLFPVHTILTRMLAAIDSCMFINSII